MDEFHECADGDEAVAAYGALRPDWVLMDSKMTRMGGLESHAPDRHGPPRGAVLIVTAYDDAHWRAAAIKERARAATS